MRDTHAKPADMGAMLRHMSWLIKQINELQATRQYSKALQETNDLERRVWDLQQALREL